MNRFLNRLLCLLLIPMLMHGTALAHSHAGTGVEQPSDHAARPHVHLPFGHHHHARGNAHNHNHDRLTDASHASSKPSSLATSGAVIPLAMQHDANAIFLGVHHPFFVPAVSVGNAAGDCDFERPEGMGAMSPAPLSSQRLSALPPDRHAGLPIYLQVASLRL